MEGSRSVSLVSEGERTLWVGWISSLIRVILCILGLCFGSVGEEVES